MTAAAETMDHQGPSLFRLVLKNRNMTVGLIILAVFVLLTVFAPFITPFSPSKLAISNRLLPPGGLYLFGTDEFGRDIFTRVIYAGRLSLLIGAAVVVFAAVVGVTLGMIAGFFPKLDLIIARIIDAMMAFPDILLAIAMVAALGPSLANVIIALGIVYAPRLARVVRASTLVIRELPYVEAARGLGISTGHILIRHVLRNLLSPILVQCSFFFAQAMLAEAGLSFLGVGVDPSIPTWGTMIATARQYVGLADWMTIFPGLAIVLAVLSLQMIGDGMRDLLDPKIRKDM